MTDSETNPLAPLREPIARLERDQAVDLGNGRQGPADARTRRHDGAGRRRAPQRLGQRTRLREPDGERRDEGIPRSERVDRCHLEGRLRDGLVGLSRR